MQNKIIDKLEHYNNYINGIWKIYVSVMNFPKNGNHIFINDMLQVDNIKIQYPIKEIINKKTEPINFEINKCFKAGKCKFIPRKVLPKKLVDYIYTNFMDYGKIPEWDNFEKELDKLSDYLLYSTIDTEAIKNMFASKTTDTINILILGAGPTGMYIANYLYDINLLSPKINMLIIDNKIPNDMEGFRLPYTRNRIYGLNLQLINSFFATFPCVKDLIKKGGIPIRYLENILLIFLYKYNIPIYFTNQINDETSLKKFIKENKIDIVFDCTGKKFKNNLIENPSENVVSNFYPSDIILENDKYKIHYEGNEFQLQRKNHIENRFYISMDIHDKNGKYISTPIWTYDLIHTHDVKFFSKFHNTCLKIKPNKIHETIKLFDNLMDLHLSKMVQQNLLQYSDKNIKFFIIEPKIYHKILISSIIKQQKQNTIYISTGDSMFSSHFAVGAGLNRLLRFINRIIWYIQTLSSI